MSWIAVLLLAVLQGLTEFLPVSSSGHLALAGMIMKVPQGDISFEITVHLGTLCAVLAVYMKDILRLLKGLLKLERDALVLTGLLVLGSIPAGLAGFFLSDWIEGLFAEPAVVSAMLILTGSVLFSTRFMKQGGREHPAPSGTFLIGISQALALLPGVSRSGLTISTGLLAGVRREAAARFSFLLSVPAIIGASVLKLGDGGLEATGFAMTSVGFIVSALTGYLALRILLRFVKGGKLSIFSWYCWLLGSAGLAYSLMGG